jgi:glutathione S-transferase
MIAAQGPKAIEANIAQIVEEKARAARRNILELGIDSPIFLEALQAFVSALDRIDATLGERNWLAGDSLSLADAAALPYVLRLDDLSMSQLITARPRLAAWHKRMQERPSYATAITSQTSPMVQVLRAASAGDWPAIEILAAKMALPQN